MKNILLVDNSVSVLNYVSVVIEKFSNNDFQVITSEKYNNAIKVLSEKHIDLILLDLNLEDSNGVETFHKLRKQNGLVPIIILTSSSEEGLYSETLKMGAQDFINKSDLNTNPQMLIRSIRFSIERFKFSKEKRILSSIASKTFNNVLILNREGEIQWVNDAFEKNYGYKFEEIKNTKGEILRKELPQWIANSNILENSIKENKPIQYELKNYPKYGGYFWSSVTISPVFENPNSTFSYFIVVESDITERVLYERKLQKAKNIAIRARKAEEEFIENISHEIRTPLNGIIGLTDLSLEQNDLSPDQRLSLEKVLYSSRFLLNIIGDVLDFSKISKGNIEIESIEFDLLQLLEEIKLSNRLALNKNMEVEFITVFSNKLPEKIIGDSTKIKQIIVNILSNAFKFTNRGFVKMSVCPTMTKETEFLKITIEDTGIGIEASKQNKIFEKFKQEDVSTSRKYGGTGLGLSIVKKLVTLMDGKLVLSSTKTKGTRFDIYIPFKQGKKIILDNEKTEQELTNIFKCKSILVAEDNQINQLYIKNLFKNWGVEISCAIDGQEAISMAEEKLYDVILMDVQMPNKDGYVATKEIRKLNSHYANTHIIALTASASTKQKQKCLKSGMNDYMTKPFKKEDLKRKLNEIFT